MMKFPLRPLTAGLAMAMLWLGTTQTRAEELVGYINNTHNSEDMVLVPGTKWVIASSDATPGKSKPGYLYAIDSTSGIATLVKSGVAQTPSAGDPSCRPVNLQDLATSGLALRHQATGKDQLLVVNHGDRMSIEFFDVDTTGPAPALTWTGCVAMPGKAFPNSVVPIEDGGIAVTISFDTDNTQFTDQLDRGEKTGYLLEWRRDSGFNRVPGGDLPMDNGLQIDSARANYYIAAWGSKQLLRLPRANGGGKPLLVDIGIRPDNITWSNHGTLLVAGHAQSAKDVFRCVASDAPTCPVPFKIIEVDPKTMSILRVVIDGLKMKTFSAATTGLQVGDEIWASSFRNSRIARYRN